MCPSLDSGPRNDQFGSRGIEIVPAIAVDFRSEWSRALEVSGARISEIQYRANHQCPMHWHAHPSLGIVLDGEISKRTTNSIVRITKNLGFTLPSGILHNDRFGPGARVVMVELDANHPSTIERLRLCVQMFDALHVIEDPRLSGLAQRIAAEMRKPDRITTMAIDGLIGELLSVAARATSSRISSPPPPGWLVEAREIARSHLTDRIQVADIARQVGVHPAYLARRFRAEFGVSPASYARSARLQWAAEQLATTTRTIADIADEAGFADQSHFTRVFRKHMDETPGRYRELHRHLRNDRW